MIRIVHIITGLNTGGAETMLASLLAQTNRQRFDPTVVCLTADGPIGDRIRALGVPVHILGMPRGLPTLGGIIHLTRLLREIKPDIVQTCLYHSDLIGGIAARLAGIRTVAWAIHNTVYNPKHAKRSTILVGKLCAMLAPHLPKRILSCSQAAMKEHIATGYPATKMKFIPNGFDLGKYRPDSGLRRVVRQELGIDESVPIVGLFARFDPMKDHHNFLHAAEKLSHSHPETQFILCGQNVTLKNNQLRLWIEEANLQNRVHLLGVRADVPRLLCALDILALSSRYGEAFPMIIGEAMATGVPCVATDVGDTAYLIGEMGYVVPPAEPASLADAMGKLLALSPAQRAELGVAARERIQSLFEIGNIAERYAMFYENLIQH